MKPTSEQLLWMYEKMLEIREYEESMAKVYLEGKLPPKIQKGLAFDLGAGQRGRHAPLAPLRHRQGRAAERNDGRIVRQRAG